MYLINMTKGTEVYNYTEKFVRDDQDARAEALN